MNNWTQQAACKGQTHLFFPPAGERTVAAMRRTAQAVALCKVCPVADTCSQYAADRNEQHGIWGGVVYG
jgi:WhiB family redox-sensing transcriptional regulator